MEVYGQVRHEGLWPGREGIVRSKPIVWWYVGQYCLRHPCDALLVGKHSKDKDWGFLLIDAQNLFNENNRTTIIWAV